VAVGIAIWAVAIGALGLAFGWASELGPHGMVLHERRRC
jgi:hypothetical protein